MSSGARTFGLETLAEPEALPPPPVRHALLVFLVALAAILHIGTAGWSDIHNGAEGLYAAAAKEMLAAERPLLPRTGGVTAPNEPPLFHWIVLGSYRLFGVSAVAARIPVALAFVATVALTFLIGERLAGYWRGFVAGLIYLCSCGGYIWGRFVTPEPLFAAVIAACVYCALAGYQQQRTRRWWFIGFGICVGAAYLTRGAYALLLLTLIIGLPAIWFREARMRFASLFHWSVLAAASAIVAPWLAFLLNQVPPGALLGSVWVRAVAEPDVAAQVTDVSLAHFVSAHLLWWFPALLLVFPGIILAWRKVIRPHEFDFATALPLCWAAAAFLPIFSAQRQEYDSVAMWSGFALAAALVWDRIATPMRLLGIGLVALVGLGTVTAVALGMFVLPGFGHAAFPRGDNTVLAVAGLSIAICCAAATYLVLHGRDNLAITTLLIAMVPIGLGACESIVRSGPHLSFAPIAHFLQTPPWDAGDILFEGSPEAGSSLLFYVQRPVAFVADEHPQHAARARLSTADALDRMGGPRPAYLIIHKDRVPWWQAELTRRFHIYHQVTASGAYVVVNNQP